MPSPKEQWLKEAIPIVKGAVSKHHPRKLSHVWAREDMHQDLLLILWQRGPEFVDANKGTLSSIIYAAALNLSKWKLRQDLISKKNRPLLEARSSIHESLNDEEGLEDLELEALLDILDDARITLSETDDSDIQYRLLLHYMEHDKEVSAIAKAAQLPEPQVLRYLRRSMRRLAIHSHADFRAVWKRHEEVIRRRIRTLEAATGTPLEAGVDSS